jgi:hypothetical protein
MPRDELGRPGGGSVTPSRGVEMDVVARPGRTSTSSERDLLSCLCELPKALLFVSLRCAKYVM